MPTKQVLFFFPENPFSNRAGNTTRAKKNITILKNLGCNIDLVGYKSVYEYMGDSLEYDHTLIDNHFLIKKKPKVPTISVAYWRYKWLKLIGKKNKYNSYLNLYAKQNFEDILKAKKYDCIVINYEMWSDLIDNDLAKNTLKVIDTHDWITLNEFFKDQNLNVGERFNEEIKNLDKFDKVITISNDEYFVFKGFLGEKVINIPPSFPISISETPKKKWDLMFVGSENIFNVKSIEWFFEKIYPQLNKNIKILIVGRAAKYVPILDNVETIYFAESLSEYYHQSKIALCPMLEGTGIKIKVVEALSFGIPVVGTSRSVDGFSSKINNGCLISDNPEGFRNHILSLLHDESYYREIQAQAMQYFKANFSENAGIEKWKQILNIK